MGRRYHDPERANERAPAAPGGAGLVGAAELGLGGVLRPDAPKLPRRPAALLLWHRERWQVLAGRVVPLLGQLVLQAGVARVKQRKDGSFDVSDALAHKAKRGWSLVPLDVDGPGTSYLWRPVPGVTLSRWERTHAGSSVVTTDVEGYASWCESLVPRLIPRPPAYVIEDLAARWGTEVLRLEDQAQAHPSARPDLERARSILRVVNNVLDELRAAAPPLDPDGDALDLDTLTAAPPHQEP